ncbi:hypothetical protein ASJ35_08295 [Ruthenibacterium lactatiformans]|uniref:Uncharacterized protein n=1 Tax=Ruthenibacterium lactatiformans TaxID=1550024 RepID=A0A0D8J1N7_9FIRM|nr:hypothetical protein TQ39_03395 [Ruthenibacterium lactatiformans]KUE76455.1 hypothetical protein ASJ35_08295 [Ruthenibacterium lactatiformans]
MIFLLGNFKLKQGRPRSQQKKKAGKRARHKTAKAAELRRAVSIVGTVYGLPGRDCRPISPALY